MSRLGPLRRRWLALLAACGVAVLLVRPWAGLRVDATVVGATDAGGTVLSDRLSHVFSRSAPPRISADYDLAPFAGELLRIELKGTVVSRWHRSGTLGDVGWALELVTEKGAERLDFIGWQGLAGQSQHVAREGSLSFIRAGDRDMLASPRAMSLWRVIRVPERARLRVVARPLIELGELELLGGRRSSLPASIPGRSGRRPDVFIYVIDAWRRDRVGCYGFWRPTTPAIDAFAKEAVLFENAQTPASWTRPAVGSLLTGLDPLVHGTLSHRHRLPDWPVTLAEALRATGYGTVAISTNGNVASEFGFGQGFEAFHFRDRARALWAVAEISAFLRQARGPVFAYLHTVEPHSPYQPSPENRRLFDRGFQSRCDGSLESLPGYKGAPRNLSRDDREHLLDLYDAEVRDADAGFAEFLATLKRTNRYQDALIILTADHGESFGEHGTMQHGDSLAGEELHIPLIVKLPGGRLGGTRAKAAVTLTDLYPTVLHAAGAGVRLQYSLWGQDIFGPADPRRPMFAHVRTVGNGDCELVSCTDEDGYKRVLALTDREHTVPDLAIGLWGPSDLAERTDLSARLPVRAAYEEQLIAGWLLQQQAARGKRAAPEAGALSEDLRRSLKALGYVK